MTRFGPENDTPLAAEVEEEDTRDSLFERWLTRSPVSQPRLRRSGVPAPAAPTDESLGDDLADRWFR
ncbi:MAG: hypothetical protein ABSE49_03320 [Polyangiaceae bacterium]|jgi:hypothetical protein